jgi:putative transcriptional regulator
MEEFAAYLRGEIQLRTRVIEIADIPDKVDVQAIRTKLGISQSDFARRYGFSHRTVREWEQGRSAPDSAVRAYLTVIDRNPQAVSEALNSNNPTIPNPEPPHLVS